MTRILYGLCGRDAARPFSPHVWKTMMAMGHKGLDYRLAAVPFTAIPKIEQGETRTVPYLVDGDTRVVDSFAIAAYLDQAYPDRPTLFGGPQAQAQARLIESWSQMTVHPAIVRMAILKIHDLLDQEDQAYFRASREKAFGRSLEEVAADGEAERAAFAGRLDPLRRTLGYQPFIGGESPLFADYIVFGALQWLRIATGSVALAADDPVLAWFERCLDLHDGLGHSVAAA
ncbi:beta-aryl ether-cleaving protein [Xaviernesmea oryzae]|uniref:Beta-aryl ether-cleaving protein n=1 Tax=Xaviernesmea oryzae TaxID=464029 RepID=A0A1Q9AT31_9HYPH|nr:glutathione S-transferase family protein [Xaviernesmea oryzae]OLP58529.1 beta-aryl ether-cleaving protein [Xaviernesmea oryzae]SEK60749.1 Glutathione S-transferase [Xaviernesmea oryzae]